MKRQFKILLSLDASTVWSRQWVGDVSTPDRPLFKEIGMPDWVTMGAAFNLNNPQKLVNRNVIWCQQPAYGVGRANIVSVLGSWNNWKDSRGQWWRGVNSDQSVGNAPNPDRARPSWLLNSPFMMTLLSQHHSPCNPMEPKAPLHI